MKKVYLAIICLLKSLLIGGCFNTKNTKEVDGYIKDIELVNQTITEDGKDTLGPEMYIEEAFDDYKEGIDKCYEYVVKQQNVN